MAINVALTIAFVLVVGGALCIAIGWRRAPTARRAMTALAVCFFAAGGLLGYNALLITVKLGTVSSVSSPSPQATASPALSTFPLAAASPAAPLGLPCTIEPRESLLCGKERWLVKTLSDADASTVNLTPVASTVSDLVLLPTPAQLPQAHRIAPTELQVYKVRAVLIEFKREEDDDIHLVLADPADRSKTMIAEIPAPNCADTGRVEKMLETPRCEFVSTFGEPTRSHWTQSGAMIELTGVGFFDFQHHQNGVAPNAIELHPVLDIRRIE